jgi:ABC-type lipoprotein export system ATPase subunit
MATAMGNSGCGKSRLLLLTEALGPDRKAYQI